jgi:hypothetical protein
MPGTSIKNSSLYLDIGYAILYEDEVADYRSYDYADLMFGRAN